MARLAKSKTLGAKPKAKVSSVRAKLSAAKEISPAKAEPKKKVTAEVAAPAESAPKKVSQRLIETIEKRKQEQAKSGNTNRFGKPAGRRGRRPKNVHYTPQHTDDDSYAAEGEFEGLEYDTGIRVASAKDESGFGGDRFEEFDEELNFDW